MPDDDRTEHRLWQELERLSAAWDLAMISNDAGAIGRFMADDWVIVRCNGAGEAVDVALAESTLTGFLSWLEAAPPGALHQRL